MNPRSIHYLDASARNETIARRMLSDFAPEVTPPPDDWIITLAFYSALHLVDAFLVDRHRRKPTSHIQRDQMVDSDPILSRIAPEYSSLKGASVTARYQPLHSFPPYAVQEAFDLLDEIREVVTTELHSS